MWRRREVGAGGEVEEMGKDEKYRDTSIQRMRGRSHNNRFHDFCGTVSFCYSI